MKLVTGPKPASPIAARTSKRVAPLRQGGVVDGVRRGVAPHPLEAVQPDLDAQIVLVQVVRSGNPELDRRVAKRYRCQRAGRRFEPVFAVLDLDNVDLRQDRRCVRLACVVGHEASGGAGPDPIAVGEQRLDGAILADHAVAPVHVQRRVETVETLLGRGPHPSPRVDIDGIHQVGPERRAARPMLENHQPIFVHPNSGHADGLLVVDPGAAVGEERHAPHPPGPQAILVGEHPPLAIWRADHEPRARARPDSMRGVLGEPGRAERRRLRERGPDVLHETAGLSVPAQDAVPDVAHPDAAGRVLHHRIHRPPELSERRVDGSRGALREPHRPADGADHPEGARPVDRQGLDAPPFGAGDSLESARAHPRRPVVGGDEQSAFAVACDEPHHFACGLVGQREVPHPAAALQPGERRPEHPERALAVSEHRANPAKRQAAGGIEQFGPTTVEHVQRTALRRQPYRAVAVDERGPVGREAGGQEARLIREPCGAWFLHDQRSTGPGPDPPCAVFDDDHRAASRQTFGRAPRAGRAVGEKLVDAALAGEIHRSRAGATDKRERPGGGSPRKLIERQAVCVTEEALAGRDPRATAAVQGDEGGGCIRRRRAESRPVQPPVLEAREPSQGGHPQPAVAGRQDPRDPCRWQSVRLGPCTALIAVVPEEPLLGTEPEEAIDVLRHRNDATRR